MARPQIATWLQRFLLVVATVSLGFYAWTWIDTNLYQWLQQRRLNDAISGRTFGQIRQGTSSGLQRAETRRAEATRREISRSGVIGRIEIPRLGVRAVVAEGTSNRVLRRAVGHLSETALPGEPGNVALAGHRDSFFRRLAKVKPGDRVRITTPDGVLEYRVDSHRVVGPEEVHVLAPSSSPTLTLITCFPFNYIGSAPERFVVRATQVEAVRNPVSRNLNSSSSPAVSGRAPAAGREASPPTQAEPNRASSRPAATAQ